MADTTKAHDEFGAKNEKVSHLRTRPAQKHAILVAGMHRSGTSAITRVLSLLGCSLPKTLVPASQGDNDRGFWESPAIVGINNEILESAGSRWDDWNYISDDWFESGIAQQFLDRAADVLIQEYGNAPLIAIKDPRICRFLPVWTKAVELAGYEANIVVPIRHPLEVAESLFKRSQIDASVGQMMWLRHVLDAERFSRDYPRSFMLFDGVIADWRTSFKKLQEQLNVVFPRVSPAADEDICDFLSPDLWRNKAADLIVSHRTRPAPWIDETYSILKRWAAEGSGSGDIKLLDETRSKFSEATPLFVNALRSSRSMRLKVRDLTNENSKLEDNVKDKVEAISILERRAEEVNNRTFDLENLLREAKSENLELGKSLRVVESELEEARTYSKESEKEIAILNTEAQIIQDRIADLKSRIEYQNIALEESEDKKSKETERLTTIIDDAQKRLIAAQISCKEEKIHRVEADKFAADLKAELHASRERVAELHLKLETQHEALARSEQERFSETAKLTTLLAETHARLDMVQASYTDQEARRKAADEKAEDLKIEMRAAQDNLAAHQAKFETQKAAFRKSKEARFSETARLTTLLRDQEQQAEKVRQATLELLKPRSRGWLANKLHLHSVFNLFRKGEILRQREIILAAGIFDQDWYLAENRDVALSGVDPLQHYLTYGALEGRAPGPSFS